MSKVVATGKHWKGFAAIRHLVVFGASYSSIGYSSSEPHPTPDEPLGVPWPGSTVTEPVGKANWVGHLVKDFAKDLLVYDYAVAGAGVDHMAKHQIEEHFMTSVGLKPEWAPWTAGDALFVIWMGMNDLGPRFPTDEEMAAKVDKLFEQQATLYNVGARNFLFVDVMPMHRTLAAGMIWKLLLPCVEMGGGWKQV